MFPFDWIESVTTDTINRVVDSANRSAELSHMQDTISMAAEQQASAIHDLHMTIIEAERKAEWERDMAKLVSMPPAPPGGEAETFKIIAAVAIIIAGIVGFMKLFLSIIN